MAKEFSRTDRVSQQVHKEVASILQHELKHRLPQLGFITVSGAEVSRDLAHAKIFLTFFNNDEEEVKAHMKLIEDNKGFVRSLLSKRLRMRSVPHLHFLQDISITEGMRISNLVSETISKDQQKSQDRDGDDTAPGNADKE
ncbi:MAG: 30S ribosome-binding factor RbfA [Aestuariibacter sp.]